MVSFSHSLSYVIVSQKERLCEARNVSRKVRKLSQSRPHVAVGKASTREIPHAFLLHK